MGEREYQALIRAALGISLGDGSFWNTIHLMLRTAGFPWEELVIHKKMIREHLGKMMVRLPLFTFHT